MNEAFDRLVGEVSDRVGQLLWAYIELGAARHELERNRIVGFAAIDQACERRRNGRRISGGHFFKLSHITRQPCPNEIFGGAECVLGGGIEQSGHGAAV